MDGAILLYCFPFEWESRKMASRFLSPVALRERVSTRKQQQMAFFFSLVAQCRKALDCKSFFSSIVWDLKKFTLEGKLFHFYRFIFSYSLFLVVSPLRPFLFFPARRMWRHGPQSLASANNSWSCVSLFSCGTHKTNPSPAFWTFPTCQMFSPIFPPPNYKWWNSWMTSCDLFWLLTWEICLEDFYPSRVQGQICQT